MAANRKVLLIEDDSLVRMMIAAFLEDSGYLVVQAHDGQQGLAIFPQENPDIVITDLRMPNVNGFEVLASLKAGEQTTPVIVMTGEGDATSAEEALQLGAEDCLAKPLTDMLLLTRAIERALDRTAT